MTEEESEGAGVELPIPPFHYLPTHGFWLQFWSHKTPPLVSFFFSFSSTMASNSEANEIQSGEVIEIEGDSDISSHSCKGMVENVNV